jgi:hypothetical protein
MNTELNKGPRPSMGLLKKENIHKIGNDMKAAATLVDSVRKFLVFISIQYKFYSD